MINPSVPFLDPSVPFLSSPFSPFSFFPFFRLQRFASVQYNHPVRNETPATTNRMEIMVTGIICQASETRLS